MPNTHTRAKHTPYQCNLTDAPIIPGIKEGNPSAQISFSPQTPQLFPPLFTDVSMSIRSATQAVAIYGSIVVAAKYENVIKKKKRETG